MRATTFRFLSRHGWPCALCAVLLFAASGQAEIFYFSDDHADIAVGYSNGVMELFYGFEEHEGDEHDHDHGDEGHDHGDYFARHADDVITIVSEPSQPRPAGSQWDRIGNNAGDPVWVLPQSRDPNKPFLGISTTALHDDDWEGPITWSITNVEGPGEFAIFQGGFSPNFQAATFDGLDNNDSWQQGLGGHDHHNFTFTAPGDYQVTIMASGTHVVDGFQFTSDVFTFRVVPEPSTLALAATACVLGAIPLLRRRRHARANR